MGQDAAELVRLRNQFYRDNYYRVVAALLLMIVINAGLIGIIFYQLTHTPPAQYFATSADGKITKIHPLNEPVIGQNQLLQWASLAAIDIHSYDFVNYRKELQEAQARFSARAWREFEAKLKQARTLEMVLAKHLVVHAVATGAPVPLDTGVVDGRYTWKVQLPLLITYESASEQTQQPVVVTMVISRMPIENNPDGIAITSYVESVGQVSG